MNRLRINNKIVGYRRNEGSALYYSKDAYGWSGTAINYEIEDASAGLKDKNNRSLFEHDIVKLRFTYFARKDKLYRIVVVNEEPQFIDLENGSRESVGFLRKSKSITFVSHTFLNVDSVFAVSGN